MPFQKGVAANPSGKKRSKICLTDWVKAELNRKPDNLANVCKIAERLVKMAIEGDAQAIKLIWDRVEGPVTNKIEHSGELRQTLLAPELADKLNEVLKYGKKPQ